MPPSAVPEFEVPDWMMQMFMSGQKSAVIICSWDLNFIKFRLYSSDGNNILCRPKSAVIINNLRDFHEKDPVYANDEIIKYGDWCCANNMVYTHDYVPVGCRNFYMIHATF